VTGVLRGDDPEPDRADPAGSLLGDLAPPDDLAVEEDRHRISFLAPAVPALAIEHGLEVAQRVLGWEAPRDECLGALLSEAASSFDGASSLDDGSFFEAASSLEGAAAIAGPEAAGPESASPSCPTIEPGGRLPWANDPFQEARRWRVKHGFDPPKPRRRRSQADPKPVPLFRMTLKRTSRCLNRAERALGRVDRLTLPAIEGFGARVLIDRYHALQAKERPLIVFQARLLALLHGFGGAERLGLRDTEHLGATILGASPRTVRNLLSVGGLFQGSHALADAYVRGVLGMGQLLAVFAAESAAPRVLWRGFQDRIERSKDVTLRQFRREMRFLVRLVRYDPSVYNDEPGLVEVESLLRLRLFRFGWTQVGIERALEERGLALPGGSSTDPAENPVVLSRLETLLDLLVLGADALSEDDEAVRHRKTLSTPGRQIRVTVWAKPAIHEQWERVGHRIQAETGRLPAWALATLVVQQALGEWERHDPERLPTERKILERDGYQCQAPGCSMRRTLQAHHIIYRSHHGPDHPWNLTTTCFFHHQHGIHKGRMRVTGRAPHDLVWELGCSRSAPPRWIFRGEKRVRAWVDEPPARATVPVLAA